MKQKEHNNERLELNMSRLLIAGVVLSGGLVALGGIIYLWRHGLQHPDYGTFSRKPSSFSEADAVFTHIFQGSGRGIIMLGILVLIATPIARIVFAIIGFAKENDRLYTVISMLVLGIIVTSLLSGVAG